MLVVQSRTQARKIGSILNAIAGKKVVKQSRTRSPEGWTIPRVDGVLQCPAVLKDRIVAPSKRLKRKLYVVGVDLVNPNKSGNLSQY